MLLGGYRNRNINTGFWLKILLEIQLLINEKSNSKLIDVIYNRHTTDYIIYY
nr:MAG TPA: hypothetical protein [Herelleviridae sp.]